MKKNRTTERQIRMMEKNFGDRLKKLRQKEAVTQQQLVLALRALGSDIKAKSTISQYENNKRSPDAQALVMIAKHFNVTTDFLAGVPNCDAGENALVLCYRALSDIHRGMVVGYAKALGER
jgi:transcriptional regulator with XRE-family HTH domain